MTDADSKGTPSIFVTVGTDHHPFDRIVDWVDAWQQEVGRFTEILVQRGTSRRPATAASVEYMPYDEMISAVHRATAVVTHGGPGTIMLAVASGKRPIVVPRRHDLGEHVDDHQVFFARRISGDGTTVAAETKESFFDALRSALVAPDQFNAGPARENSSTAAVENFEELVQALVHANGSRGRRWSRVLRRHPDRRLSSRS